MSMKIFPKEINLGKKRTSFLLLIFLLSLMTSSYSQSCDQVASLPKDFSLLMPQYEKLKRIHMLNFFFLDDAPVEGSGVADSALTPNRIQLKIKEKSHFKLQITPQHVDIQVEVKLEGESHLLEGAAGLPVDFTSYQPINPGVIELIFTAVSLEDEEAQSEIRHKTSHDKICDSPYMKMEVYLEEHEHLQSRLKSIHKESESLNNIQKINFNDIFTTLKASSALSDKSLDNKSNKYKIELEKFKLELPKDNKGLHFYQKYNISVLSEWELSIPDNSEDDLHSSNSTLGPHIVDKFFLKLQLFGDFFLHGSHYFMLLRTSDLDSLDNLQCLFDGNCFLADKPGKNSMLLESILTPGDYKILLIDLSSFTKGSLRQTLKLDSIPLTGRVKIKYFQTKENRFNCEGRHLPANFDYLQEKSNYFEYKGDIVMNLNRLYDQVEFSVEQDSILRLITFYSEGNNIEIELHEVLSTSELSKLTTSNKDALLKNAIIDLINKVHPTLSDAAREKKVDVVSENSGESDGLVYPLKKGVRYKLVFNYNNSFFLEKERKHCEMFYLKLAIEAESHIKSILPSSCNGQSELDNLLHSLGQNHSLGDFTETTKEDQKVSFNSGENNIVIYQKKFEVKQPINLNIEVISDFVSSYIVPVIIPLKNVEGNINNVLHHKHKKLTFHENNLKLKLNKGSYMFVLVNGLSQYNSGLNSNNDHNKFNLPFKCMSFKLRISSILLKGTHMKNWECNYLHYDVIPENLNDYLFERSKVNFFNKNLLLPNEGEKKVMKFSTGSHGYLIRLISEYIDKNEYYPNILSITLHKKGKVVKTAKEYIIDKGFKTDQVYLNYYLEPNTEYEIKFENTDTNQNYFESCKLFKLDINLITEDSINKRNEKCEEHSPSVYDVVYERLIDVDNSFYKYGSKSPIEMFTSTSIQANKDIDTSVSDLEVTHTEATRFTFKLGAEPKSFTYEFEVKSFIAKGSLIIENTSSVGLSAKISSIKESVHELIASEDLEGEGLFTVRSLMLPFGKYALTFYVNTEEKNYLDHIKGDCVSFGASFIIENKPYDIATKNEGDKYENCPYVTFPDDLNTPGWIHADTAYSLNENLTFKLKKQNVDKKFTLHERSIFKFHIPNEDHNNFLSYISLYKLNANNKSKLLETFERESNYLLTVLEKGSYSLQFILRGVGDTPIESRGCNFFTVFISVVPISQIVGGIDSFNPLSRDYCDERGIHERLDDNFISPNSFMQHVNLKLSNVQIKDERSNDSQPIASSSAKIIKLKKTESKGKFVAELIYNNYIDVLYKFVVYEITNKKKVSNSGKVLTEVPVMLTKYENMVWVAFHFDQHKEYQVEIVTANYNNYSVCSSVVFSYNFEEYKEHTSNETGGNAEDEYMHKKDLCQIEDHLPSSFFTNTNNQLDKYGGPQSEANGELNFYGEFLLPSSSTGLRSEFFIRQQSIVFIKVIPKYSNVKMSNIFIQIYRDKKIIYRYSHNEHNGIILTELDTASNFVHNTKDNISPYFLDLSFDRVLSECETFELVFVIIPKNLYIDDYLSCNEEREKVPDSLVLDKSSRFSYTTLIDLKSHSDLVKNEDGNFEKTVKLVLDHPTSVTVDLEYVVSDNMMDVILVHDPSMKNEDYSNAPLEIGEEEFQHAPNLNGITTKKSFSANLKKGHYLIKIIYHELFTNILSRYFEKEIKAGNVCLGYNLDIEGLVLNHLKDNIDGDSTDAELHNLSKDSFSMDFKNVITSIDPPQMKKIKLNSDLHIQLKFAYEITSNVSPADYFKKFIYLQEANKQSEGTKIFPSDVNKEHPDSLIFIFEVTKENSFEVMKCYKLVIQDTNKEFDSEAVTALNPLYCTVDCDCNPMAHFKCSKKGGCTCYPPYTGDKCDKCLEGYILNSNNECVDKAMQNSKCDESLTCSGHGKCLSYSFDAFKINNRNGPCLCDVDFTSYEAPLGYPSTTFCNACMNPVKSFPLCGEKHGMTDDDSLQFNFESNCDETGISLPPKLFTEETEDDFEDSVLVALGGGQDVDGSLDLLSVFKVKETEEVSELDIPQDSVIRVFYETHEINRAKIMILENEYDEDPIAYTEGLAKNESFIAKLDAKSSPYILKIEHNDLKYGCNRYRLKIVIRPLALFLSDLKCKSNINLHDPKSLLPPQKITVSSTSIVLDPNAQYILADSLVFNPQNKSPKKQVDYTQPGVLTTAAADEDFVYNINLEIKTAVTLSANVLFDFLESDFSLVLRETNGKIIRNGDWLIPEANAHVSDKDFINGFAVVIDPGNYYLTLVQNVPANHIAQIVHDWEKKNKVKTHVNRCFKFGLHIQATAINKPDANLSTSKFESMYNRLVSVEPEASNNINYSKKFELFVTFEDSISPTLKTKHITFKDIFYFENTRTKDKIPPTHVYLQGSLSKVFLIIYDENVLIKDECYVLKYNLDPLQSSGDKDRRITPDGLEHKFCTKTCNCNPHTDFECDERGQCICEEPYTGTGCFDCINGWVSAKGKCITNEACRDKFCNSHGKCNGKGLTCHCDKGYTGKHCDECDNPNDTFPDCNKLSEGSNDDFSFDNSYSEDKEEFTEEDAEVYRCDHSFFPHNFDSLGYLHLDGNMHISGKYSLKHINNKHYSSVFTVKEKSHVKLFIEHAKTSHIISIFLLDNNRVFLNKGQLHVGPAGVGSASFIDFVVDPVRNADGTYAHYELNFYIKDIPADDEDSGFSYEADSEMEQLTDECFNVFVEMQIMTVGKETTIIDTLKQDSSCHKENLPQLIPSNVSLFDYHTVFYNSLEQKMNKYCHIRNIRSEAEGSTYFHYEYFYVPDHLDHELILELEVFSKFLHSQVGLLLEIVEIPTTLKLDHTKLNAKMLAETIDGGQKVTFPKCEVHCFSGAKKFNSVVLSRVLPSDTFFRIWFYDMSPQPQKVKGAEYITNTCVNFEVLMNIRNVKSSDESLQLRKDSALCLAGRLPNSLNVKGYLGDGSYLEKWGFHILDAFRIDETFTKGLTHVTKFTIKEYHLLRMVVFHGRVDTDLELYSGETLIARSNSRNFEDVLVLELAPGDYRIVFKFFAPPLGFHKCESIQMEFSMDAFHNLQQNVDRMVARHKNNPVFDKIDLFDRLSVTSQNIFEKDITSSRFTIPIKEAFVINKDDVKTYESSIALAEITFAVEPEDTGKLELSAFVNSDFLLIDANVYLTSLKSNEVKDAKVVSGRHKKNMNVITSGPLESGTYILSVRYYRRLHYDGTAHNSVNLLRANFAEIEFDVMFINKSNDNISVLTSVGYIKIPPFNSNKSSISHNWLCRNSALPIPKTLSNLRYLQFNSDMHILDNFLIPPMGLGEERVKFRLRFSNNMMIRVYIECHSVDIDLELREVVSHSQSKLIAASKESIHFETIMAIVSEDKDYEIVLQFKGKAEGDDYSHMSTSDSSLSCLTFKMEIATEKSHNFACPNNSKYAALTDLKPFPDLLPTKDKLYTYDTRSYFLGDDKQSGYVYMLRSQSDKVYEWTHFTVEHEIDIKVEIENDFMQAPLTLFLTTDNHENPHVLSRESNKLSHNALNISDASIISYGEIFENKSTLLVKNLPKGSYSLFFYLPGLATKFLNEPRVCSIYDALVEVKRSRIHFQEKEIINTAEIQEDHLDLPVRLPLTLNSLKYLEEKEDYINLAGEFFLRKNSTVSEGKNYDLFNSISFTLSEASLVEFYVAHDVLKETLAVAIDGHSHFGEYSSAILQPGKYTALVKVEDPKNNVKLTNHLEAEEIFHIDSLEHLILFYVGISPIKRVHEIYSYNSLQSTSHQCHSNFLPKTLDYHEESNSFIYHNDLYTFNKKDLDNLKMTSSSVVLKSNNNRILIEIGGDYVLNKLSLVVKSEHKSWKTSWMNNVGDLDISVPSGTYTFTLELEDRLLVADLDCLIFSIDIHVIDNDSYDASHPLYNSHVFDSSHKNILNRPKCEATPLPLEIHHNADSDYHKLRDNGDYFLHINKASYFTGKAHTQQGDNPNQVDINIRNKSIVRIVTAVNNPNEYQIIPKLKYYSHKVHGNDPEESKYYLPADVSQISHNSKERNSLWFLTENLSPTDEFYILELIQEKYEELTKSSDAYYCPYYTLDILISSVAEVAKRMQCIKQKDHLLEYILPKKEVVITSSQPYHEKIDFSFFTEAQYSESFTERDDFYGLQYVIPIEVKKDGEYHLALTLGFDQVVSLFDVYLSKHEDNDAFESRVVTASSAYFDSSDAHFPYKRIINMTLEKGVYRLLIVETMWNSMNRNIRHHAALPDTERLCLPFSYTLDIIPAGDRNTPAQLISVFPPGPINFISLEEDLSIKVVLSKPAFNKKHQAISYMQNFMNIISAFYLVKSKSSNVKFRDNNFNSADPANRVHPAKLEGSTDNKEWTLLFNKEGLTADLEYQLTFDTNYLYDANYLQFKNERKMPVFRVETHRQKIFEFVDSIQKMKDTMTDSSFKEEAAPPVHKLDNNNLGKCGEHGKLVFDNILKKEVCTCFDGFSGKFCQNCEGSYDKKLNKCVIEEEGEEFENNEPRSESVEIHTRNDNTQPYQPNKEYKMCEGGCVNGYCDTKIGKCICDMDYTGIHCEHLKTGVSHHSNSNQPIQSNTSKLNDSSDYFSITFKILFGIVILLVLIYFYTRIRKSYSSSQVDYNPLPTNEFEMSIGNKYDNSINSVGKHNDLELVNEDNQLLDYEIPQGKDNRNDL